MSLNRSELYVRVTGITFGIIFSGFVGNHIYTYYTQPKNQTMMETVFGIDSHLRYEKLNNHKKKGRSFIDYRLFE